MIRPSDSSGRRARARKRLGRVALLIAALLLVLVEGSPDPVGSPLAPERGATAAGREGTALERLRPADTLVALARVGGSESLTNVATSADRPVDAAEPGPARAGDLEPATAATAATVERVQPATAAAAATAEREPAAHEPATSVSSAHEPAPGLDEGFFELVIDRVPGRIVLIALVDERGEVMIPLRAVAEHAGIPMRASSGALVLEWPRDVWHTTIDTAAATLRVGEGEARPFPSGGVLTWREETYLSPAALSRTLGVPVDVRWADLVVHVRAAAFPAAVRLGREAARERATALAAPDPHAAVPFVGRSGGAALTWGLTMSASDDAATRGSGRLRLGGSLFGAAAELGLVSGFGPGDVDRLGDVSALLSRAVHGTPWLRRIEAGTVVSGGTLARRMLGVTLTNEPYTQPRHFDHVALLPTVPAGWEYEIYQGDALVGVSGEEARGVEVPLSYGNTPLTVRLLGPAGQEVVEDLLYVVGPRQVPAGEWRYDVGAGRCEDEGCDAYGYGEFRLGLRSWLTVGGGLDVLSTEAGSADRSPYGSLSMHPLPNLSTDLRARPGSFAHASARYLTPGGGSLAASYLWNHDDAALHGLRGWQAQVSGSGRVPLFGASRSLTGHVQLRGGEPGRVGSWIAGVGAPFGRSYVTADYEAGLQASDLLSVRTHTTLLRGEAWLRDLAVSAAVSASAQRIEVVETGVSFRPTAWGSVQAGMRMRHGEPARLTLGFVSRTPAALMHTRAVAGARGSVTLAADGGLALDGLSATPLALPYGTAGQAGVAGRVFHDHNGNGRWDADEPAAEGVTVVVAGQRVVTDADGAYRAWEVEPYAPVEVTVDPLSLALGWMTPPGPIVVRPSPNVFNEVELPLVRTREVVGRVERADGRALGGVAVELLDALGSLVVSGRTFSDGALYLQSVPPGEYRVRVAPASLDALGMDGLTVTVTVPFEGDDVVGVPTLRVVEACDCAAEGAGS